MMNKFEQALDSSPLLRGLLGIGTMCMIMAPFVSIALIMEHREDQWQKFKAEHHCKVHQILPGSAAFLMHEPTKIAWDCEGTIVLRAER